MNERIAELYDQAIVLEGNGDYVAGEFDAVKFAELIVLECARWLGNREFASPEAIKQHFGVE